MKHLESKVEEYVGHSWARNDKADKVSSLQVDLALTLDFDRVPDYYTRDGYNNIRDLHHLKDKLLPITARLQATISTVSQLEQLSRKFDTDTDMGFMELANSAAYRKTRLEGLISSAEILEKKVKDILNMVRLPFIPLGWKLSANNRNVERSGSQPANQQQNAGSQQRDRHSQQENGVCQ